MKKLLAVLLCLITVFSFAACGSDEIIVAEKGSAGETVAMEHEDFADANYVAVDTQSKALMEVQAGTADAAIVDYVTSIGSIGEGTDYVDLVVEGDGYSEEEYGIAFRKGSDMTAAVNEVIRELKADGTLGKIAETYKLSDLLLGDAQSDAFVQSETDSDYAAIMEKGTMVIGITYFAPMNYKDDNGELIGFETEFAKAVCEKLGLTPEFQEIDWDSKETELASGNIDCIWNGMTITPEREENMSISIPYMQNKQVKVVAAAE